MITLVVGLVVEHVEHDLGGLHGLGNEGGFNARVCGGGRLLEVAVVLDGGLGLNDIVDQADGGDGVGYHLDGFVGRDLVFSGLVQDRRDSGIAGDGGGNGLGERREGRQCRDLRLELHRELVDVRL